MGPVARTAFAILTLSVGISARDTYWPATEFLSASFLLMISYSMYCRGFTDTLELKNRED